ncbi:mycofactocin system creatininase family protein [Prauserella marina]|uniref:Creatinine amidohydrolase n=1 Tax=Prauserella marina TaxID=530584 RepID=A0A222VL05_9PSEU|nr:mycofactocin biosynthesis peptidyl-dipeptidase MftE [Prauserella marina]ASR34608.1 mycofactocin system creatininase family protein [Prauserella marina]PWV85756.1 creatinine amidohydrolase [Prauserella marina]SDC46390.1 creatinine amidohydrolase [Prauserella marina]
MTRLGGLRWPEVGKPVLAVPLGATEQHGPHLPLHTDTTIATELCDRLAASIGDTVDIVVAPALPYGSSGEHAGFPGTLSIGRTALELLLVELVRSADDFAGVVIVNGHGGNAAPVRAAVRLLRDEGRRVLAWSPDGPPGDSHAGRTETSVLLRLRPQDVATDKAEAGNTAPLPELFDRLVAGGVAAVSVNGVLGDPAGADAAEGEALLTRWAEALATAVRDWLGR